MSEPDVVMKNLLDMAAGVIELNPNGEGFGEKVEDLIAAAEAGNDLAFAVVAALSPRMIAADPIFDHVHTWVKTDEVHQGITSIRQYECRACLAHTVLTGPIGASSPFDVEESNDSTQDTR